MKKFVAVCCIVVALLTNTSIFAFAAEYEESVDTVSQGYEIVLTETGLQVSPVMTFQEMVQSYACSADISYQDALKMFPAERSVSAATYRTLAVTLTVTATYKPTLEFYCETSEYGSYWAILSIYSVQLNRGYNGISKQFSGSIDVWLRNGYTIEYVVNGDFYNSGTTSVQGGGGLNAGINDLITVTFTASISTTSNHYQYFYEHETRVYQT